MSASCRYRIVFSLVSVLTAVALSAHAEEPPKKPAGRAAVQTPRPGPGGHPGPMVGPGHSGPMVGSGHPGPMVGRGPDAHFARGASLPARNFGGHPYRGRLAWEGGRWHHEVHNGRDGWWWDVGGIWYYYPQAMEGPPTYVSEDFADDVGDPDGPPVGAYAPPPGYPPPPVAYVPPPPPPDPGASAVGGAIVGGVLGGLLTGRASGAAAGAVVGGATGAIAGATAAARPGYYLAQGNCYYRYPSGQYVQADPRACY
jgi:hypothetical protein